MKDNAKLGILSSIFAILTSWLGNLAIPVYTLVACNIIDYITGVTAAKNRGKVVSSSYGFMGIVKKIFMWFLIYLGVLIDRMLEYIVASLNIPIVFPYVVGCAVAIWLVLNEIISILENMNDIGVPMPPFLMPLVQRLKVQVEKKTEESEEVENEEDN